MPMMYSADSIDLSLELTLALPIPNLELLDGDWATIWQNALEYTPKSTFSQKVLFCKVICDSCQILWCEQHMGIPNPRVRWRVWKTMAPGAVPHERIPWRSQVEPVCPAQTLSTSLMSKIGEYVKKQHQCLRSYLKLVRIQRKMECNWAVVVELVAV